MAQRVQMGFSGFSSGASGGDRTARRGCQGASRGRSTHFLAEGLRRCATWLLAVAVAGAGPAFAGWAFAAPAAGESDGAPALEQLLLELREKRDEVLKSKAPRVRMTMEELEKLGQRTPRGAYEPLMERLRGLGDVAVPLYVDYLEPNATAEDPGAEPTPERIFRSREVAALLEELPMRCVREELLALARSGSPHARVNAVRVLGSSSDDEEVVAFLERTFAEEEGVLKFSALRSLARIGGERALEVLRGALGATDTELLGTALMALAEGRVSTAAGEVLGLAQDEERGPPVARALTHYYAACPEAFDGDVAIALLKLVRTRRPSAESRVAILRELRDMDVPNISDVRSVLRDIATASVGSDVAEEAHISLALMNDSKSRRKVLDPYDDRIKKNDEWAQAFRDRGVIHMKLRDYRAAQRDFRDALELLQDKRQPTRDVWVLLARSHALDGRLKNAAEDLRNAVLSTAELQKLRDDPEFAELRDSRYGKVFDGE